MPSLDDIVKSEGRLADGKPCTIYIYHIPYTNQAAKAVLSIFKLDSSP